MEELIKLLLLFLQQILNIDFLTLKNIYFLGISRKCKKTAIDNLFFLPSDYLIFVNEIPRLMFATEVQTDNRDI